MTRKWKTRTLGSLCNFVRGPFGGSLKKSCFKTSGYAVYEQQHAIYDQFEDIRYFIDELKYLEMSRFELSPGDLIMSCSGTMGKVAIVPNDIPKGIINQALLKLSPGQNIISEFLKYWMNSPSFQNQLIKFSQGVAIKNVASVKILKEIQISLPPVPEQKRIVAILDEAFEGIDRAIANTEENLTNARELFESYLSAIFIHKGDDWEEKKLGDIATFRNGLNFTKSSKGELIKIVGVKDFQDYFWIQKDQLDSVTIDAELKEIDILRKDDILAVRSNGNKELIGRCVLAGDLFEKISHSGFTIRIRIEREDIYPQFIVHFLKSKELRRQLMESGGGISISSLNQQGLSLIKTSFPNLAEQKAIVENIDIFLAETQRLETIYRQKLAALNELKQSILQKAFTGELTAENANQTVETAEEEIAA